MAQRKIRAKLADYTRALLDVNHISFTLFINKNEENRYFSGEAGHDVVVRMRAQNRVVSAKLSDMTRDELAATKEFWDISFAQAQSIVEARDRIAQEAFANGDDSYHRLYRQVPRILVREGTKFTHYPFLRKRSEWVASLDSYVRRHVINLRGGSLEVLDDNKEGLSAENSNQETGDVQDLREVGWDGDDLGGLLPASTPEAETPPA